MSEIKVNSIKGVGASTAAITVNNTDGTCTANVTSIGGSQLSNRNLIINGAMQVAQRGTSTANIGTTLQYGVDRFHVHNIIGTAVQTATQENDAPEGFYKSLKVTCTTADTDYSTNNQSKIEYRIEGTDIQRLNFGTANAKTLAVSFYIKSNKTGNSAIGLLNNANNRSFVHQFNIASANTWQKVSFTVAGDTTGSWPVGSDNIGIRIRWGTFGTDFQTSTLDAWQAGQKMATSNSPINFNAATNDYLQITGVQLEVGSVATDFEHRSIAQELLLCQRYYYRTTPLNLGFFGVGNVDGSNQSQILITFPTEMRSKPTSVETSGTAAQYALRVSTNATCSSVPAIGNTTTVNAICEFNSTSHGFTSGQAAFGRSLSDAAFLGFAGAEL